MSFYFKNTRKDIVMTDEDEEDYRNIIVCQFSEREVTAGKVRDHCLLTGKYTRTSHNNCNINVNKAKF